MYYEEQIIGGLLHYRTTPKGMWITYNFEELSNKVIELREELVVAKGINTILANKHKPIENLGINKYTTLDELFTFLNGE